MKEKHNAKRIMITTGEDLILLDSFDRSKVHKSQENAGNVALFRPYCSPHQ